MKKIIVLVALLLSACGDTQGVRPEVSRAEMATPSGMTYNQFRDHDWNKGGSSAQTQKRFLLLDRDNNGVLSENEIGGF